MGLAGNVLSDKTLRIYVSSILSKPDEQRPVAKMSGQVRIQVRRETIEMQPDCLDSSQNSRPLRQRV